MGEREGVSVGVGELLIKKNVDGWLIRLVN